MPKKKSEPIKPHWKPAVYTPPDLSAINLTGVTYEGSVRKHHVNEEDRKIVGMAGYEFHKNHPEIPVNAAITMAFCEYWRRYEG